MSKLHSLSVIALAAAFACGTARAAEAAPAGLPDQKLDAALRAVDALQHRIELLEQRLAATDPAGWGTRIEAVEHSVSQVEAAAVAATQVDTGLPIHGFADVGGGVRNSAAAQGAPRGFKVGVFDLYMTPQISPQVKALVELALEYDESGTLGVDAERMQLGYAFSDALTVWAGRFHTPYGYWNTAFHHGAQLQTSIARPRFLDFEDGGGTLPAHSVGAWATGSTHTALGKVGYDFYVINGDRIQDGVLDFQARGDSDHDIGAGFRAAVSPTGTGWTVGVHGLDQQVHGDNSEASAFGRVQLRMTGGFATYDSDDWEAMAEYYHFSNHDLAGATGTHASNAWYAQAGYNLNDRFTPYVRIEDAALAAADPYFALQESGTSYRRAVAGVRYNLTPKAALKLEWLHTRESDAAGAANSLAAQYAIRF